MPAGFAAHHVFGQIKRPALFFRYGLQVALPAEFHAAAAAGEAAPPLPHHFDKVAAILALINFRGHRNPLFAGGRPSKPENGRDGYGGRLTPEGLLSNYNVH